ncbi:hypothetical protein MDA_GLEAN10015949 [Myotis davidii]|uniref:Uncharacterized protein n=1 Tax=Myotis davidii TaxID=225400 RepID=L5M6M0_MYODS|nr:hypothetical protein MDA_GLEAN10015949 [Myotis davidii]
MGGEKGLRAEPSCRLAHTRCPQALGVQLRCEGHGLTRWQFEDQRTIVPTSWRKSLSDLEMTVEVLFAKQCELGGKQSEELTPMRTLLLVKPADAHSVL